MRKKNRLNCEMIWKSKLKSEKMWEIWKKTKLNSEKIWEIQKNKGNNKITEIRTILQRESQNS
jgi:hypothetical protein